jgi:hypothetical protein
MSNEYIKKWAERLVGYVTKKHRYIQDAENEIFNVIKEHMKNVCKNVEVSLEDVEDNFTYGFSIYYTFSVKYDDEEIILRANAYDYVDIEIDSVDQW